MMITMLLPLLVTVVGMFLLFRLKFFFIFHPIRTLREFVGAVKDRNARRSLILALAGTLGVGNIFGVSAGIMIGGAGSLFWLLISSVFAMIIKYSETVLVFDNATLRGGMSAVLNNTFPRFGKALSTIYAITTVLLSLFMGSSMQSAAVLDVAKQTTGHSYVFTAMILIILLLVCLAKGVDKIEKTTEIIIPMTTIIYILLCFCAIFANKDKLEGVINDIVYSAFMPRSAVGGISAIAIKEGFARGILSNEAGVGTSAFAHARSRDRAPHIAGLFGMCEVIFDSIVLCMLTGISILVSIDNISDFSTPMDLVFTAFQKSLGSFLSVLLLPIIFAFAYSTIICWYYYGRECINLYFPRCERIFLPLFLGFVLTPRFISSVSLICIVDVLLLVMSLMTLSAILKKSNRIATLCLQNKNPE